MASLGCSASRRTNSASKATASADVSVVSGDGQQAQLWHTVWVTVRTAPDELLRISYPFRGTGDFFVFADDSGNVTFSLPPIALGPQTVTIIPWTPLQGTLAYVTVTGL